MPPQGNTNNAGNGPPAWAIHVPQLPAPSFQASWKRLWRLRQFVAYYHFKEVVYSIMMVVAPSLLFGSSISLFRLALFVPLLYFLRTFVHRYIGYAILPAQRSSVELLMRLGASPRLSAVSGMARMLKTLYDELGTGRRKLMDLGGRPMTIAAVDGAPLDVMFCPARSPAGAARFAGSGQVLLSGNSGAASDAAASAAAIGKGLVIVFGGNGELYEWSMWPAPLLAAGYSVLLPNFRGVGRSPGNSTKIGLLKDAASVIDFAVEGLRVPRGKVVLLGHSLGGGLASVVAPLFPGIHFCHERSFASLSDACVSIVQTGLQQAMPALMPTASLWVPVCLRVLAGWELDAVEGWPLHLGKALITVSSADRVLPPSCQLPTLLQANNTWGGFAATKPWQIRRRYPSGVSSSGSSRCVQWGSSGHTLGRSGGGLFGLSNSAAELTRRVAADAAPASGGANSAAGAVARGVEWPQLSGSGSVFAQGLEVGRQWVGTLRQRWSREGMALAQWCCRTSKGRGSSSAATAAARQGLDRQRLAQLRANAFRQPQQADDAQHSSGSGDNAVTSPGSAVSLSGAARAAFDGCVAALVVATYAAVDVVRGLENGLDMGYLWVSTALSLRQAFRVIRGLPAVEGGDAVDVIDLAPQGDAHNRMLTDREMSCLLEWIGAAVAE